MVLNSVFQGNYSFHQFPSIFSNNQLDIFKSNTSIADIGKQRKWVVLSDKLDAEFQSFDQL